MKKQLTTGQRLAYMLRTAVVEAQAVEAGRHPTIRLNMSTFGIVNGGVCQACLGGVYAILGLGLPPGAERGTDLDVSEYTLEALRTGDVWEAAETIDPIHGCALNDERANEYYDLVRANFDTKLSRADWDTYLEAADILERA